MTEQVSPTELYIQYELGMAEHEERNINDTAARLIAGQLHGGQASALYSLASTGAVDYLGIASEVLRDYADLDAPTKRLVNHLGTYAVENAGREPVPGWHELTRDDRIERLLGEAGIAGSVEAEPSELDTIEIGGKSLRQWHDWLTHDGDGNETGHLRVPCSRYGRDGESCSWWAIAAEVVQVEAIGEPDSPDDSMDYLMGIVVNDDNGELAGLIAEFYHAIPQSLRDIIGTEDDVRRLDG